MFGNKRDRQESSTPRTATPAGSAANGIGTLIGSSARLVGDLFFAGQLRIDGRLEGTIRAEGEGESRLVVSEQAEIVGDIEVPVAIINGSVTGNVRATKQLIVQEHGRIAGEVAYRSLEITAGGKIHGSMNELSEAALNKPALAVEDKNRRKAPAATLPPAETVEDEEH